MSPSQKIQFTEAFEQLPDAYKREVLDFVEFLAKKSQAAEEESEYSQVPEGENPLHAFIGAVEHGRLAEGIDKELYG